MPFWRSKPKPPTPALNISAPMGSDFLNSSLAGGASVKRVVLAGHGSFNKQTDARFPKVRLPPSVTLMFWCRHGEGLFDDIAQFIEGNTDINELPDYLKDRVTARGNSGAIPEIVRGGSEIWNYRLTYPSGLTLGNRPASVPESRYNPAVTSPSPANMPAGVVGDRRYVVMPPLSGDIKDRGVPIIALLAAHWNICDGAVIHWCACRSIADR
jgi:hypothetical protein